MGYHQRLARIPKTVENEVAGLSFKQLKNKYKDDFFLTNLPNYEELIYLGDIKNISGTPFFSFNIKKHGVFMIDWIACYITGSKSLLKLQYTGKQTAIVAFLWILGATGVGAISAFSEVININRNAVLAIGCSWPIIFTKLIKSTNLQKPSKKELDESEAEQ